MSKEKKKIKIEIKAKDVKNVPVMLAVDIFQSIQNIIYSIGDHLKGNPPRPKGDFYPRRKPIIKALLYHPAEEYEMVLKGRIIEFRVDQKRQFEIDTPEGIVRGKYSSEIEDYIIRHIGELVQARGVMSIVNKQHIFSINDDNALKQISTFPIQNFLVKNDLITFKQPINVEVGFENEQYIFSEDKLKLLVVTKNVKDGITGIKEEMTSVWVDYILANEQELNGDAIKFKKYLLSLIKGRD